MSDGYIKCDRCGKFFLPTAKFTPYRLKHVDMYGFSNEEFDFCVNCKADFREWINNSQKYPTNERNLTQQDIENSLINYCEKEENSDVLN